MEHAEIRVFDSVPERRTHSWEDTVSSDFVFLCLPTPQGEDGRCDTSAMDEHCRRIREYGAGVVLVKSTVPVGWTKQWDFPIIHNPEFLTARCAVVDYQTPSRLIFGLPREPSDEFHAVYELHRQRFPGVPQIWCKSDESELIKLCCNSFFAAKVTMFNLFRRAAEQAGANWQTVREGILTDGRIAHAHTMTPGPDGRAGYGGACLTKDLANFTFCANPEDRDLLKWIDSTNSLHRNG